MKNSNEIQTFVPQDREGQGNCLDLPAPGMTCISEELKGFIGLLANWIADDFLEKNAPPKLKKKNYGHF